MKVRKMLTDENKHTWCYDVNHALRFDNNGTTTACCMMRDIERQSDKGKPIRDMFYKPELVEVRDALNSGVQHSACTLCWQEEAAGRKSKRLRDNEKYLTDVRNGIVHEEITSLELNLGNICNIKCRTCSPTISTTWIKEWYDIYGNEKHHGTLNQYTKSLHIYQDTYADDSPFWDDIVLHLKTLRSMVFYGGEPLLSKRMWKVLEMAVEMGYSKNISLEYNTNGTVWHDATEVWKDFKSVSLSFSIDGTEDQFTYMRYPADWNKVTNTMQKAREFKEKYNNMYYGWCVTLSNLNIFYVREILDENYKNFRDFGVYLNLVHGPEEFNINQLPNEYKNEVIAKLESVPAEYNLQYSIPGIIEFIRNGTSKPVNWEKLFTSTKIHDKYREQKYSEIFPEFAKLIGFTNE